MQRDRRALDIALKNYKSEKKHQRAAESMGNLEAFKQAQTLTRARKLAYGDKKKDYSGYRGHPDLEQMRKSGQIK